MAGERSPAAPAVLGVDVGTSSTKGVLVATDGTILRTAVREHEVDRPAPGHVEMDARLWWEEFASITAELTAPGETQVQAIGVSGMGPCVLLADQDGEPVRPAILYGVDARAGEQIARLTEQLGEQEILARGGSVLTSQAAGPKIAWIREHEPEAYARAQRFLMPASYLALKLTGAYVLDHHSASQSSPLYDSEQLAWHQPWAKLIAPGLLLPELRWPGDQAGTVTAEAASVLPGIEPGTPVITGSIDAWTEAVSADAQNPGDLMLMYGTTMFLVATTDQRVTGGTMWGTVGAFENTYCLAGGMATSGAITAWLRRLTGEVPYPQLLAEADAAGPGAGGLLMLPYFAGERTPVQDPDARGVIAGLTLDHGRGHLYRAALEATAFGVRHNVEELRQAGAPIERVVAVGGGTQGGLWTRIVSDVTGIDQVIPTSTVGASYGAAMLAADHADGFDGEARTRARAWNPPARTLTPDPERRALYDELYRSYRELYPATRGITHALAALQRRR
ncbi:FGGY family carbohydrate kinase [Brachybacterium muris]|uniref:FGGY-family carbohydrate kinase n=1 Tax=Brachybacterium muris TaxID=219301 RepID=UPI00223B7000|nr:FGGY family carbohydrate kinase [Brachybacterium muris]